MTGTIDVLVIDDDKFLQKIVCKTLTEQGLSARVANDGLAGLEAVRQQIPDIILLDVEMPGINGYEVCDRLRSMPEIKDVPIVFLSSHGTLRERLQGYEVGADDYLVKPFEAEHLQARIRVLLRYREQRQELNAQYELARETAIIAMTGSNELGQAMHFLEKSLGYGMLNEIADGLFDTTDKFNLDCCLLINSSSATYWFSSQGSVSPLEKELMEMSDKEKRFFDFGARTIVNFPHATLMVKNMPLEDMDRYGRLKDLLPILLSAINTKVNVLDTHDALVQQNNELLSSFANIRSNLYYLAKTIFKNREHSNELLRTLVHDISYDMLRMGLEQDQEDYLIQRIDAAIDEAMVKMDAGQQIAAAFISVNSHLKAVTGKQEKLVQMFIDSHTDNSDHTAPGALEDDIELF